MLLDTRAWDGLGAGARASLLTAVRGGLGVLIHAPQTPSAALRGWLRGAGLTIETGRAVDWQPDVGSDDVARLRAWMGPGSDDAPFDPLLAARQLHAHDSVFRTPFAREMAEWRPDAKGGRDDALDAASGAILAEPVRLPGLPPRVAASWRGA